MADNLRYWTTVGSVGTLSAADLAKVSLNGAVIQLGIDLVTKPPPAPAAEDPSIGPPPRDVKAVVRYNVTPVDGLFPTEQLFAYALEMSWRGTVGARLVQFDLSTGTETELLGWAPSQAGPPTGGAFFTHTLITATPPATGVMDFVLCSYYVEATLVASAVVVGNAAEIASVKVFATTDF
jgi:hypothetical protein